MQVNATDIFRVGSGVATGTARKAAGIGAAGGGTRAEQDIVSISDLARQMQARDAQAGDAGFVAKGSAGAASKPASSLAEALTGEVGKIFSHLSDAAKGKLEAGVASGKVSVKEVEEGLKFLANQEVAIGVQRARQRSPQEIADSKELSEMWDLQMQHGKETGEIFNKMDDLSRQRQQNVITDEQFSEEMKPLYQEVDKLDNKAEYKDLSERYNAARDKAVKLSTDAWMKELGGPPNEAKWQASMEKLDAIGFDVHRNRDSFRAYAASQETPTIFRADAA